MAWMVLRKNRSGETMHLPASQIIGMGRVARQFCILLIGVIVAGCAFFPFQRDPPALAATTVLPIPSAPKALTESAALALNLAEQCVADARKNHTLWTVAVEKLVAARHAAKLFNSDTTITLSQEIIALCARSAAQAKSPPVTW